MLIAAVPYSAIGGRKHQLTGRSCASVPEHERQQTSRRMIMQQPLQSIAPRQLTRRHPCNLYSQLASLPFFQLWHFGLLRMRLNYDRTLCVKLLAYVSSFIQTLLHQQGCTVGETAGEGAYLSQGDAPAHHLSLRHALVGGRLGCWQLLRPPEHLHSQAMMRRPLAPAFLPIHMGMQRLL